MKFQNQGNRRRWRSLRPWALLALALVAGATVLAGCGSGSSSDSTSDSSTTAATTGSATSKGDAGVEEARREVAKYSKLVTSFDPPGPSLKGVSSEMKGKTVWYIPVFGQAPYFSVGAEALEEAMKLAGAKVHVCDAEATPSQASSCIQQAINAGAAAIVTVSVSHELAAHAYDAAIAAHVPVVATGNGSPSGFPQSSDVVTIDHTAELEGLLPADWIIADSDGEASVLWAKDTSAPAADAGREEFDRLCPECDVTYAEFTTLTADKLPTAISSGLTAHPSVTYLYGSYDEPIGTYALQGAKQLTGRSVTFLASGAHPGGLQRIANGEQTVDVGNDPVSAMWVATDAVFRLLTSSKPGTYQPVVRLFTEENLPSDTSAEAFGTGEWFSNGSFKEVYRKNWGL